MTTSSNTKKSVFAVSIGLVVASSLFYLFTENGRKRLLILWEGDREWHKKNKAFKKLDKISKSLDQIADSVEEMANGAQAAVGPSKEVSAYYHFASDGTKFRNKWDEFDVDKALEDIDGNEDQEEGQEADRTRQDAPPPPPPSTSKLLNEVAQHEHNVEKLMGYLDQVRGDEEVKAKRREMVEKGNELLARIDEIKVELAQRRTG